MPQPSQHLSDQDLLLLIDGELPAKRSDRLQQHLASCTQCQTRRMSIEGRLDFLNEHASEQLELGSTAIRSRALLGQKLAEDAAGRKWGWSDAGLHFSLWSAVAIIVIFVGVAISGERRAWKSNRSLASSQNEALVPNRSLTPGAIRTVTLQDICASNDSDLDPAVSSSTIKAVLEEYGIPSTTPMREYQIDYLVNPQLGGTADIKNLWPEPYSDVRWNARAKDELERQLHQMVCDQKVDLTVAQREIETDWIAAYKKYIGRRS